MVKAVVTLRSVKGSQLTHNEVDSNFTSLRDSTNSGVISLYATGGADDEEELLVYLPTFAMTWEEDVPGARGVADADGTIDIYHGVTQIGSIVFSGGTGAFTVTETALSDTSVIRLVSSGSFAFTSLSLSIPFIL